MTWLNWPILEQETLLVTRFQIPEELVQLGVG